MGFISAFKGLRYIIKSSFHSVSVMQVMSRILFSTSNHAKYYLKLCIFPKSSKNINLFALIAIIIMISIIISAWVKCYLCRSHCPRVLRRRSTAARLLRLWVRIPAGTCLSVASVLCCQIQVSATS